mgnify:CR=1 FL=1
MRGLLELCILGLVFIALIDSCEEHTVSQRVKASQIPKSPPTECGNNPPAPIIYRKEAFVF